MGRSKYSKSTATAANDHIFSADRPIRSAADDLLGRAAFARRLADAVSEWRGNDSLVVALYGNWGIGKSSIKNMAIEVLKSKGVGPYVVEYNPWQWSGQDQLANGFFAEIGRMLGRGADSSAARKRERAWRLYAARLGVPSLVFDGTRGALTWLLGAAGVLTWGSQVGVAFTKRAVGNPTALAIGALLLALAAIFRLLQSFSEQIATSASSRAALIEARTLDEQKSELREMLAALEQPVVVVIDDVDRLRPDEVRHLFQLVKANADFPNLTYLLLFQRDVVEASIQEGTNGDGRQFLEKIIQVGFDVPPLESGRLYQALFDGLNRVLADDAVSKRFDQKHWQTIFPEMRSLFRNLRDVARFLGSLAFHVSLFCRGDSFEVNPVDLIAVEALRLFEPEVYSKVKDSKATLTSAGSPLGSHRNTKVDQAVIQTIFDAASDANREAVKELFKKLFPIVRSLLGGASYGAGFSDAWFRESRVCHEQVFDRYFLLGLPANDVSQADLDFLIDNSQDVAVLSERLIQYAKTGQIEAVLDRLEAYKERLPAASLVPFITAIMNVSDFLPPRSPGMFAFSADLHASRIVHWALKTVSDPHERAACLVEACLLSDGIYLPLQRIAEQEAKENTNESPDRYFLSDEDIRKCKDAVVTRIRKRATENLEAIPFLPYVLYRWKNWAAPLEVETWVDQLLKRGGVTKFLGRFLSTATSTPFDGGPSTVHHRVSLKALREFVSIEAIEIALGEIDIAALSEEERVAVTAFRRATKRESEGKPEDDWGRDEEDDD